MLTANLCLQRVCKYHTLTLATQEYKLPFIVVNLTSRLAVKWKAANVFHVHFTFQ